MKRIFEALKRLMLRQRLLQRTEKEVPPGKVAAIDVFLTKGTEYVVRGSVLRGCGAPMLSLRDASRFEITTHCNGNGKCFYVIPEKAGLYYILAAIKPAAGDQESATVSVTLSCAIPPPEYITAWVTAWSGGPVHEPRSATAEIQPEPEVGGQKEGGCLMTG